MITVQKPSKNILNSFTHEDNLVSILNTVFENTVRVSIIVWRPAGNTLNMTCNFFYFNHQMYRGFLITLYVFVYVYICIYVFYFWF
jgi:hypothetical protein